MGIKVLPSVGAGDPTISTVDDPVTGEKIQVTRPSALFGTKLSTALSVTGTAVALPTTALAGRQKLSLQNLGPDKLYIGGSAVTTSTGLVILPPLDAASAPGYAEFAVTDANAAKLYGISVGTSDVRILEEA